MNEGNLSFSQERVNVRQLFPFPENGRLVEENPPCLSWLRPEGNPPCTVVLWDAEGKELWRDETEKNYIVPPPRSPYRAYTAGTSMVAECSGASGASRWRKTP